MKNNVSTKIEVECKCDTCKHSDNVQKDCTLTGMWFGMYDCLSYKENLKKES